MSSAKFWSIHSIHSRRHLTLSLPPSFFLSPPPSLPLPLSLQGFRDASFQPPHFEVSILDVMRGLHKAKLNGLLDLKKFDLEFYEYCDHPAMADLHEIVRICMWCARKKEEKAKGKRKKGKLRCVFYMCCEHPAMADLREIVRIRMRVRDACEKRGKT